MATNKFESGQLLGYRRLVYIRSKKFSDSWGDTKFIYTKIHLTCQIHCIAKI